MGAKEDVLRALQYGKTPYYNAITAVTSYQAELARVRTDYNERTWIDFTGFLPKFTTEEFEKRRIQYQARYGNTVNVPGFNDVVHVGQQAKISAEERAAHLWASKRGLPSPLTQAQLQTIQYKKFRFLKALASATPTWMKNYGAVATMLDNVEDAFVTIGVFGRIAVKLSPRLLARAVPVLRWVLLGADILNAVNIMSYVTFSAKKTKRDIESLAEKNPFHWKAKAARVDKLKRFFPTFGEFLEIGQTADQLFGVGLCLGGLMGMATDLASKAILKDPEKAFSTLPKTGTIGDFAAWAYKDMTSNVDNFKTELIKVVSQFEDPKYLHPKTDPNLTKIVYDLAVETSGIAWDKIKSTPEKVSSWFSNTLIGSMIMSTGKDDFLKEDHTKAFMMLNSAIQGLMPWWIENDPLEAFKDLRNFKFMAPWPTDPTTIDMLEEHDPEWRKSVKWPHLDKEYATIEEIAFTYAPMIKDSFQTYCLKYSHEYEAMIAAQQVVDFVKNVIKSYSDDHECIVGMTAWWAVAEDMAREIYLMPPDTDPSKISALADYVGNYERLTTGAPAIKDVARYGESIGIEWMRTFPARAFNQAAEIFPEWQAIQDQLDELYVAD